MNCYIFCENGRVSRFNSGDLAGKLKPSIGFRKYALRAENNARPFSLYRLLNKLFCSTKSKPERLIRLQAGVR